MAQGGAFNVSQLIRELGLQTISGDTMRVLETVQPVMAVGDLSGLTPPHVPPSEFVGGEFSAVVDRAGKIELQCLAPGGLFVDWITTTGEIAMRCRDTTFMAGITPDVVPAGVVSRVPPVSLVRRANFNPTGIGAKMVMGDAGVSVSMNFGPHPIFVPNGFFFSMEANQLNARVLMNFGFREVPASEHVPA